MKHGTYIQKICQDRYPQKVFANQLITVDDLLQFKRPHPDMVGIKFFNLQTKASQNFLKSINRFDTFKMGSYEIKKEINSEIPKYPEETPHNS